MTQVSTHLFYGLFVKTPSLLIASEAFVKLEPCFLAIDLIQNRELNSQLQINPANRKSGSALTMFPVDVWNLIKDELIGIELKESEERLIRNAVCDNCAEGITECHCGDCWITKTDTHSWESVCSSDCDLCHEDAIDFINSSEDSWKGSTFIKKTNKFLATFYLELTEKGEVIAMDDYFDDQPLSPITVRKEISQECALYEESTSFYAVTTLLPSDFELPFSVEFISRQFKLLQRVYGIEFGDHRTKTVQSQTFKSFEEEEQFRNKKTSKAEMETPSWHLVTRGFDPDF